MVERSPPILDKLTPKQISSCHRAGFLTEQRELSYFKNVQLQEEEILVVSLLFLYPLFFTADIIRPLPQNSKYPVHLAQAFSG